MLSTGQSPPRPTEEVAVGPEVERVGALSATPLSRQSKLPWSLLLFASDILFCLSLSSRFVAPRGVKEDHFNILKQLTRYDIRPKQLTEISDGKIRKQLVCVYQSFKECLCEH